MSINLILKKQIEPKTKLSKPAFCESYPRSSLVPFFYEECKSVNLEQIQKEVFFFSSSSSLVYLLVFAKQLILSRANGARNMIKHDSMNTHLRCSCHASALLGTDQYFFFFSFEDSTYQ
jgi:hypothetical protein